MFKQTIILLVIIVTSRFIPQCDPTILSTNKACKFCNSLLNLVLNVGKTCRTPSKSTTRDAPDYVYKINRNLERHEMNINVKQDADDWTKIKPTSYNTKHKKNIGSNLHENIRKDDKSCWQQL